MRPLARSRKYTDIVDQMASINISGDADKENSRPNVVSSGEDDEEVGSNLKLLTSTPAAAKAKRTVNYRSLKLVEFPVGSFYGTCQHKDGSEFSKCELF